MAQAAEDPLKSLKAALQDQIPDLDTFAFTLSTTLSSLNLHPTSVPSSPSREALKSVARYLPSVQIELLKSAVPTFLHALDEAQRGLLRTYFVPTKRAETITLDRVIAQQTYSTLSSFLRSNEVTPLPRESREYLLELLVDLLKYGYGINDAYWAVWSSAGSSAKEGSAQELKWEESVGVMVGIPSKVANAVGKWKSQGWGGDVPDQLVPKCVRPQQQLDYWLTTGHTSTSSFWTLRSSCTSSPTIQPRHQQDHD